MEEQFINFRNRIIFYRGSVHQIDAHFDEFIKFRKDNFSKLNIDFNLPLSASRLVYRNIATGKYEITNLREVNIENLDEKIEEVKIHYSNYCSAQCFESFESLIKNLLSMYYLQNPAFCTKNNIEIDSSSFKTCKKSLLNSIKGNNKYQRQLFKKLYQINPKIKDFETDNFIDFDFKQWYKVLSEIRHSITHSDSQLDIQSTSSWSDFQKRILNEIFNGKNSTDNIISISTLQDFDYLTEKLMQHAQLIFDGLQNNYPQQLPGL